MLQVIKNFDLSGSKKRRTPLTKLNYKAQTSSQSDPYRPIQNIQKIDPAKCWKTSSIQQRAEIDIYLDEEVSIYSLNVRNFGSPQIKILGIFNEEMSQKQFELVPATILIPRIDFQDDDFTPFSQKYFNFHKLSNPNYKRSYKRLKVVLQNPYHSEYPCSLGVATIQIYTAKINNKTSSSIDQLQSKQNQKKVICQIPIAPDEFQLGVGRKSIIQTRQQELRRNIVKRSKDLFKDAYSFVRKQKANGEKESCKSKLQYVQNKKQNIASIGQQEKKVLYETPCKNQDKDKVQKQQPDDKDCEIHDRRKNKIQVPQRQRQSYNFQPQQSLVDKMVLLQGEVVFAISGFENPERRMIINTLVALGAKYKKPVDTTVNLLIGRFKNAPKFVKVGFNFDLSFLQANKLNIPIVNIHWYDEIIKTNKFPDYQQFHLN